MTIPADLIQAMDDLAVDMLSYMEQYTFEHGTPPYGKVDVAVCRATLEAYLSAIFDEESAGIDITAQAEKAELELDIINDKCGYALIDSARQQTINRIIREGARRAEVLR